MTKLWTWPAVRHLLGTLPHGRKVFLPIGAVDHPRDAGAALSVGLPAGQRSDWRFPAAEDCTGVHVHEVEGGWSAHLDRVHPDCGLLPHLQADAPGVLVLAGSLLGLLLGAYASRPTTGLLVGLAVGAAVASGGRQPAPSSKNTSTRPA